MHHESAHGCLLLDTGVGILFCGLSTVDCGYMHGSCRVALKWWLGVRCM